MSSRSRGERGVAAVALLTLLGRTGLGAEDAPVLDPARAAELQQLLLPPGAREVVPPPAVERVAFDAAVRQALGRNPTVAVADAELRRAAALLAQARAAALPTLAATANYVRLDGDRILGQGDMTRLVAGADQLAGNMTLSVPLLAPSRWAGWLHAHDAVTVAERSLAETRRQLAVATARAYLQVLVQGRLVQVSQQARNAARAHSDYAADRLAGGVGNRLDAVRAKQELRSSEAQLETAEVALARSREALGLLVGADRPLDCLDTPDLGAADPDAGGEVADTVAEALASRTDLALLSARVWASARIVRHGWVDYLPTLQGTFAPFFQAPPSITQPLFGWQAQLTLGWTLYDGGLRYGIHAERRALYTESRLNLLSGELQARSEVRAAIEALRRARLAERAAVESSQLAAEAASLAALAYRTGVTNNLQVVDAERRARDAAVAAAQAEDASRQARLDLLVAAGRFPRD